MGDAADGAEERKMAGGGRTICQRRCQLGSSAEELIPFGRLARSPRTRPSELVPAVGHASSPPEFVTWRAKRPARDCSPSTRRTVPKLPSSELVLLAVVSARLQRTGSR
jgi:hypothetical protein